MNLLDIGAWFILVSIALSTIASILTIGKKREATTPGGAALIAVINLVVLVIVWSLLDSSHRAIT